MKSLKETWSKFAFDLEELLGIGACTLRSSLSTQAKAFIGGQRISHMKGLAAVLDNEKWFPCGNSAERQAALKRLRGQSLKQTSICVPFNFRLRSVAKRVTLSRFVHFLKEYN